MTVNDVFKQAMQILGKVKADGTVDTLANPLAEKQVIGFINSRLPELSRLEGNTDGVIPIANLIDNIPLSEDTAMRILPFGIACDFARIDGDNANFEYTLTEFEKSKRSIGINETAIYDCYNILSGMGN